MKVTEDRTLPNKWYWAGIMLLVFSMVLISLLFEWWWSLPLLWWIGMIYALGKAKQEDYNPEKKSA